jgi:hypothetical protein
MIVPFWVKMGGVIAVSAGLVSVGWNIGYGRAESKVGGEAKVLVLEARAERDQCKGEIGKYNAAVADQTLQQNNEMKQDRERTIQARKALEAAVKELTALQQENLAVATLAREYLKNAADACSGAPMDPEFNILLERLANPTKYGHSALSSGADGD